VWVAILVKELRKRETRKHDLREELNNNMDMEIEGKAQELAFKAAKLQLARERDEEIMRSELFIQLVRENRQMLLSSPRTTVYSEHQRVRFEDQTWGKLAGYPLDMISSSPDRKSPKRKRSPSLSSTPSLVDDLDSVEDCAQS